MFVLFFSIVPISSVSICYIELKTEFLSLVFFKYYLMTPTWEIGN